jgi:hypothetical protein
MKVYQGHRNIRIQMQIEKGRNRERGKETDLMETIKNCTVRAIAKTTHTDLFVSENPTG